MSIHECEGKVQRRDSLIHIQTVLFAPEKNRARGTQSTLVCARCRAYKIEIFSCAASSVLFKGRIFIVFCVSSLCFFVSFLVKLLIGFCAPFAVALTHADVGLRIYACVTKCLFLCQTQWIVQINNNKNKVYVKKREIHVTLSLSLSHRADALSHLHKKNEKGFAVLLLSACVCVSDAPMFPIC